MKIILHSKIVLYLKIHSFTLDITFFLKNFLRLHTKWKLRKKKKKSKRHTHIHTHTHTYVVQIEYQAKHTQSYYSNTVT